MTKTIAVINMKGGVGKTTASINLAVGIANEGKRTLIIDLDPQADSTDFFLDVNQEFEYIDEMILSGNGKSFPTKYKNLHFIPSRENLAKVEKDIFLSHKAQHNRLLKVIKTIKEDYDYIIIDCSHTLNILTVNALNSCDDVIIPIKIDVGAEKGFFKALNNITEIADSYDLEINHQVLFTMVNRNNTDKEKIQMIKSFAEGNVINNTIRNRAKPITDAGYEQKPIIQTRTNIGLDYKKVVQELISKWEKKE